MKKFIVIAYDVEDNRCRRQVAKLLESVGRRVNKSVFECFLTEAKFRKLRQNIDAEVTSYDSILYYSLCRNCIEKIDHRGVEWGDCEVVKLF